MGGKKIKVWTEADKQWLRDRYFVDTETGRVWYNLEGRTGSEVIPCKVGPSRKQYLAVAALISGVGGGGPKWTKVRLHMLVWFFETGAQSMKMIDHKDGDPVDQYVNRFSNLREATDKQNCANKFAKGYRSYVRADGRTWYYPVITWKDRSTGKTKSRRGPLQETPELARQIYLKWKKQRFGEFTHTGDITVSAGSLTLA